MSIRSWVATGIMAQRLRKENMSLKVSGKGWFQCKCESVISPHSYFPAWVWVWVWVWVWGRLLQPFGDERSDLCPCSSQFLHVGAPGRVHVGAVSCPIDVDSVQGRPNALQDAEGMPGVNGTIGEHDVCSCHVAATIYLVGVVHRTGDSRGADTKGLTALFSVVTQVYPTRKHGCLLGVGRLKVAKFCTCLISPLPSCVHVCACMCVNVCACVCI